MNSNTVQQARRAERSRLMALVVLTWYAAVLADDDNPEKLMELIDQRTIEYAEEIRRGLLENRKEA